MAWLQGVMETPFQYNGQWGIITESNGLLNMRARYYSPYLMRFLNADPIGFSGGANWFAYAGGDPIRKADPFGLYETFTEYLGEVGDVFVGQFKGAGENLSFGIYQPMYTNSLQRAGGVQGDLLATGAQLATGVGALKAGARQATKQAGKEFSHWIPARVFKNSTNKIVKSGIGKSFNRSMLNGNMVSSTRHALHDPFRYQFMKKAWKLDNPMPNKLFQQLDRLPTSLLQAAGAFGYAGTSQALRYGDNGYDEKNGQATYK